MTTDGCGVPTHPGRGVGGRVAGHEYADGAWVCQGRVPPRLQASRGEKLFGEAYEFIRTHPAAATEDEITDARRLRTARIELEGTTIRRRRRPPR
jgi:hypothetical protein